MPKNPQSLTFSRNTDANNFQSGNPNSDLGPPTVVQTNTGTIIRVIKTGGSKYAQASTGQETLPEQFDANNSSQNISLINTLISTYFPDQTISKVLQQEPATTTASTSTPLSDEGEAIQNDNVPLDLRLVYLVANNKDKQPRVLYSLQTDVEKELVDGFMIPPKKTDDPRIPKSANNNSVVTSDLTPFYGVPAIMSEQAYINLQAAGGKGKNKNLVDRSNQPRFYDYNNPGTTDNLGAAKTPTTTNIINWSTLEDNAYKFPYKYQDFVFCKWWQKIPNNYMVTLRRYPYPVSDAVTSPQEARKEVPLDRLYPVATMVTYLGEDAGNKISSIVGPIETGLKWKPVTANVWDVSQTTEQPSINNPAANIAKVLGFLQSGAEGAKNRKDPMTPIDPYNNGPYVNKILGPVNVITEVQARERGLNFKHEINLVFEYSIRSIGGINTKAAGLDILANALLMTSASAPFWGGMNRFAPHVVGGLNDPFLGGDAGRSAWLKGDPNGFFNALKSQFSAVYKNIADLFNNFSMDGALGGLATIITKGATEFMKLNTTQQRGQLSGLHALLTGAPTGEWHLQVGSPFNPLMMIGNLICTNSKIEFNDELGPDDFPTELKITITLEHAMPRDKDAIESMFNYGQGRIYALPKGYADTFYSSRMSVVDKPTSTTTRDGQVIESGNEVVGGGISSTTAGNGGQGSRRALMKGVQGNRAQRPSIVGGEKAYEQMYSPVKLAKDPITRSAYVSLYGLGTAHPVDDPITNQTPPSK
ncbi:MAG: Tenacibaculum phage PTm1 [Bacteroidota bacterium]|jgi:hypothetical protein